MAASSLTAMPLFIPNLFSSPPSRKLNIALVGAGAAGFGQGKVPMLATRNENVVAICDVDSQNADLAIKEMVEKHGCSQFTGAVRYTDFRKMLERKKDIDAVIVTTPDHTHFHICLAAMQAGKHVFCEKPLTHTIWEARDLQKAAKKYRVVTQMGNQGRTTEAIRLVKEWYQAGLLGEVREVVAYGMSLGGSGLFGPDSEVPAHFNWDLWQGPVKERPHSTKYYHAHWRKWWDFGSGDLGDFGTHTMEAAWWAMDLGAPAIIESQVNQVDLERLLSEHESITTFQFPARGAKPPVTFKWCQGGDVANRPLLPKEMNAKEKIYRNSFMIGDKATLESGGRPSARIIPESKMQALKSSLPPKTIPRLNVSGPHQEFFAAIKEDGPTPCSHFEYAAKLTEFLLLGVIAQRTGKRIEWDEANCRITNDPELNQYVRREPRRGWEYTI